MSVLARLTISRLMWLVALLPMSLALLLALLLLQQANHQHQAALTAGQLVQLALALDRIAHTHAVERGSSAGFLASGDDNLKSRMVSARQASDAAVNGYRDALARLPAVAERLAGSALEQRLKQRDETRRKVDSRAADNGAFAFYSQLNSAALDSLQLLLSDIEQPELADRLALLNGLSWVKERAGQSRGMLNGVLAAGKMPLERYGQLSFFQASEADWWQRLQPLASGPVAAQLQQLSATSHWRQVQTITQAVMAQTDHLDQIDGPPPAEWFALATSRIEAIDQLAAAVAADLLATTNQLQQHAQQRLWLGGGLLALLIMALLLAVAAVVRRIGLRVNLIRTALEQVDQASDFSCRIALEGNDELAAISRSVDGHLLHMGRLFGELRQLVAAVEQSFSQIRNAVVVADNDAAQTTQHLEMVATAVNEMSETSGDIASHMATSALATDRARNDGHDSLNLSHDSATAMAALTTAISRGNSAVSQLGAESARISQVLSTIRGIAEQTNLLALNAAIEAARAGEQGRGFAVVADEVRNLAQRTQQATDEINGMLASLAQGAEQALTAMSDCQHSADGASSKVAVSEQRMRELASEIERLSDSIIQVSAAAEEQSQVSSDINRSLHQVAQLAETSHHSLNTARQVQDALSERFVALAGQLTRFRIDRS